MKKNCYASLNDLGLNNTPMTFVECIKRKKFEAEWFRILRSQYKLFLFLPLERKMSPTRVRTKLAKKIFIVV